MDLQVTRTQSSVQVAGGGQLVSPFILRNVYWTVDGCTFCLDFRTLSLANFDVVVGMDWLESHSPMQVDWRAKWLAVPHNGQVQVLQGLSSTGPQQVLLHIEAMPDTHPGQPAMASLPPAVQQLLTEYQDLFTEPTSLPPSRTCDHEIPLIPGA